MNHFPFGTAAEISEAAKKKHLKTLARVKCGNAKCVNIPLYGYKGKAPVVCYLHRRERMILMGPRVCSVGSCGSMPVDYIFVSGEARAVCSLHSSGC